MRFIFKTDYNQDIRLFQHGVQVFWYALLGVVLIAAPYLVSGYVLSQLQFICIYSIVGLGLMLLFGAMNDWEGGTWAIGIVPFLIGAGYLLVWKLEGSQKPKADNPPPLP